MYSKKLIIALGLAFFCLALCGNQSNTDKEKLKRLLNEIKSVKQTLKHHHVKQNELRKKLHQTEAQINLIKSKLTSTSTHIQKQQISMQQLKKNQAKLVQNIVAEQHLLAKQLRANYILFLKHTHLNISLDKEEPGRLKRMLTYYQYLNNNRVKLIAGLKQNNSILETNKQTNAHKTLALTQLQKQQFRIHQTLLAQKQDKSNLLQSIHQQVETNTQKLKTLLANKKALENTISRLKNLKVEKDYLTHHKGKFPWPIKGKISEDFGSLIANSQLKQNGVLISASKNQPVYAVAPGKVVFANSMPGYDLLIIIAHGGSYMSLYGNNSALFKKVNDVVKAGDLIATVGEGKQKNPALYFGVRKNGIAIDPKQWCG